MPGYNPDDYNLAGAFAEIEHELMESMMRNMRRHQKEEEQEGFEWSQWQAEQLRDLERYRLENKDKFTEDFKAINDMIADMIRQARATGKADEEISILEAIQMGWNRGRKKKGVSGEFFKQNDRKMNALIKATTQDMEKAEHAILRKANDEYRKTIFNAVAIANTGSLGYDKCIDIATRDMRRAGLRCVEYKNGSRHSLEDYADMVIKTTTKRAYLTGEGEMRAEWGISTVILNKRSSACPLCLPWVGKVMIDDVWSNGGKGDGEYPLLSHAIAEGLYHPRCKDSHATFFPGISTEGSKWTKKELQQLEEENKAEAKQKEAERQAKVHEREAEFALDPEEKQNRQSMAEQSQRQADLEAEKLVRIAEGYEEERIQQNTAAHQEEAIENSTKVQTGGRETGGRRYLPFDPDNPRDVNAADAYRKISRVYDAEKIAEATGFTIEDIVTIKRHLFFDKHKLYDSYGPLFPDYDIAVAWRRLQQGKPEQRDIILLHHELLESQFEKEYNLDIAGAHALANKQYNWEAEMFKLFGEEGEPYGLL